jgi:hypothetical protein
MMMKLILFALVQVHFTTVAKMPVLKQTETLLINRQNLITQNQSDHKWYSVPNDGKSAN